ncbi:MAG: aminopeptidase [Actinomycetota bacterium]|nr:aminopeptidase [Actinomycetota bacterium]
MKDSRAERLADIVVDYSVEVKENELVSIRGPVVAEPLLVALYERCLRRGAHPVLRPYLPRSVPLFYRMAEKHQLEFVWESDKWFTENLDVSLSVLADSNTRQLSRVDPEKQTTSARARRTISDRFHERAAAGHLRWNLTLFPTEAFAMEAGMSLDEYEAFYYSACLVDAEDPVAEWHAVADTHRRLIAWMQGRNEIHIEGEETDLFLEVGGRTFLPADGKENLPDGEIFTGPLEDKTRGHVSFSFPGMYGGQVVEGIKLEFAEGRVVNASASTNEHFLLAMLDTDPGARVLGELGIGTNFGIKTFSGETLLDEKIGGTIHLAVGSSYPESGGLNQSAVHWDMVCDLRQGGRLTADGEVFMENGEILV